LKFSDEAINKTTNPETSNAFDLRVKGLLQLARKMKISKSLSVCLSQDPLVLKSVSQDKDYYIQTQKPQSNLFKAKILESLASYAKHFSQNIGHNFTNRTILLTAIIGVAAR
jgi:hypothetical protein